MTGYVAENGERDWAQADLLEKLIDNWTLQPERVSRALRVGYFLLVQVPFVFWSAVGCLASSHLSCEGRMSGPILNVQDHAIRVMSSVLRPLLGIDGPDKVLYVNYQNDSLVFLCVQQKKAAGSWAQWSSHNCFLIGGLTGYTCARPSGAPQKLVQRAEL